LKSFDNKVAAITGAASGIGRALAIELSKQNCHLALSDIDPEGLNITAEIVQQQGVSVSTTILDTSSEQAIYQ